MLHARAAVAVEELLDLALAPPLGRLGEFDVISVKAANGVSRAQLVERLQPVLPKGLEAITSDVAAAQQADQVKKSLSFLSTFLLAFATPCATRGGRRRPPPS